MCTLRGKCRSSSGTTAEPSPQPSELFFFNLKYHVLLGNIVLKWVALFMLRLLHSVKLSLCLSKTPSGPSSNEWPVVRQEQG